MKILNADLSFMQDALTGKGINAKPKMLHKMGISRRKKKIEEALKEVSEAMKPDKKYTEFTTKLQELRGKFSDKDEGGKAVEQKLRVNKEEFIMIPTITQKLSAYTEARDVLRKKYSKEIVNKKILDESYEELILKESDIVLAPLVITDFTESKTAFSELYGLYPIIRDFEKEKLLKAKTAVNFTVKEIMGSNTFPGLFSSENITTLKPIVHWGLNVIMAYNMRVLRAKGLSIKKTKAHSDYFEGYEKERAELVLKYAEKDINGEPQTTPSGYSIKELSKFHKELEILKEKNKKIIDTYELYLVSEVGLELVLLPTSVLAEVDELLGSDDLEITQDQSRILDYFVE